ncbi:MAG: glycoside hydrolase [Acidobacteria bacterium]|nr:glycoside hydrolase [Acidobacteriota bacterium]
MVQAATQKVLHFQGNLNEAGCTGDGAADIASCNGPFLSDSAVLDSGPAAHWDVANPALNGTGARSIYDPNWIWNSGQTRLGGEMNVQWWASCAACGPTGNADWTIRLWADGTKVFEKRITATPSIPNVAQKLSVNLFLPEIIASENIVLHIDPVYIDSQNATRIYYDSQSPCPTAMGSEPCDSKVTMPVLAAGEPAPTPTVAEETPPMISTAVPPTYDNFVPPSTLGQRAGEPSIGLNWATGKAMFIAALQTLRVTFTEATPATAMWENKSAPNTSILSFDPILFTDSQTNRTFASQLLPSKISLMSFTDNDGNDWTPSQGAGINSGVDHQTVGGGPYAKNADGTFKGMVVRNPAITYPNAVYYASQDIGLAEIARSDDGGLTFGVAFPMYDLTRCGGLHGSIKVAPDGTVYVPNKSCDGKQGVLVSEDNGVTWNIRTIPGSKSGRTDPSVGIGSDGTIYVGYANGDGKPRIAVSHDKGKTFVNDQNVGFYQNINNTVFPAVTAGDPDRAAFFFLGTETAGSAATGTDQTSPYVDAVWYGFISTTYDGGLTWVTVNATPNDPVQRGVVCTNGTTCPAGTRNLLDFNDMEVDKQGRAVAALADGCITAGCIQGGVDKNSDGLTNTRFENDGARRALIIRQSSGLGLFSAYDPVTTVTTTQIEDDDSRIAYSNGWHLIKDAKASAGHFRLNNSKDVTHKATLSFNVPEGQKGAITYHYAKSTKGGSAEVFLDNVSKGVVSFNGTNGSTRAPEYGYNVKFDGLSNGSHTLELRNINGPAYVDGFTLESATTDSKPFSGPGTTTSSTNTVSAGSELLQSVNVEQGATALSVIAESNAPIRLVVVDPSGSILGISDATDGLASVDMPVTQGGTYLIKVVNLSVGPIEVFTASTALVAR